MAKCKYYSHVQPKLEQVEAWARDGLSEAQIAHNLGIAVSSLNIYKNKYKEFSDCLARGKEVVDIKVENALYKRAIGYQFEEITKEERLSKSGEIVILEKRVLRDIPPDPTSAMFWLANRRRDRWAYRPQPEQADGEQERGIVILPDVDGALLEDGGDG